ncbi:MAG: TetR/AcrR family transcriptional regulator [Myxococcales bacterium]|nr:TetR/AcrR family transcriptional regulator [Myxococcales bacterium]
MAARSERLPKTGSLRERKKARTRAELTEVAERLFRKQGYEATTLDQVADEAEVSIRTVLRYFETKQQLALAGYYDNLERFRTMIDDPDRELDTLSCWRQHVLDSARGLEDTRAYALHLKFVQSVPTLAMGLLDVGHKFEDVIAQGLAADAGVPTETDLYGHMLAALVVGGNAAAMRRWIQGGRKQDLTQACLAVVDFAIQHFPPRNARGARKLTKL